MKRPSLKIRQPLDISQYNSKSPPQNPLISILIPSWNNLDYLKACIESIEEYSFHNHQLIAIANEGSEDMKKWLESMDIDHIYSKENLGICTGLNAGRAMVKCKYMMYINDDMIVTPDWDVPIIDTINELGHEQFMLSATMIEPHVTGNPCVIVADYGGDLEQFDQLKFHQEYDTFKKEDWNGSTWPPNIFATAMWDRVGGMSEEFSPGMYSDPDLSMKFWHEGVRHFQGISASRVYHFGSKSTRRLGRNKGRSIFLKKWGMSANQFYKYYLNMGQRFNGPLKQKDLPISEKILAFFKRGLN